MEVPAEAVATGRVTMESKSVLVEIVASHYEANIVPPLRCHRIGHGCQEGPWNLLLLSMSEAVRTHNATWLIQHWDS